MGSKNKQNGEAEGDPMKDEDVGAEGDETTDDEGGVDTPPPQKEEEEDAAAVDDGTFEVEQIVDMECKRRWKCPVKFRVRWVGYSEKDDTWLPASHLNCEDLIQEFLEISGRSFEYKNAMTPKKRAAAQGAEMTMQTRKAMRYSYSELDEDADEVMPAGTRTRKPKVKAEPKIPKPIKKKSSSSRAVGRGFKGKPVEYEVEAVVDHRVRGRFTEYKVRWKGFGPKDDSWLPEAELNCDNLLNKYFKMAGRSEEEAYEVQEIMSMRVLKGKTEYKVRWKGWSAKYDSWLPEEELNCPDLLKRFIAARLKVQDEEEEEEEEYEVEKIIDERKKKNKKEYLVQWKNKGPKHNSWEPEQNLENCKDVLTKYFNSLKTPKKQVKSKGAKKKFESVKSEPVVEVDVEPSPRSRRAGKNRSYSEFYDQ